MQPLVKGSLGARQGFEAHGADDIGRFETIMQPLNALYGKSEDELGAVDEGEPFLRAQAERGQIKLSEYFTGSIPPAFIKYFAQAYQWQE